MGDAAHDDFLPAALQRVDHPGLFGIPGEALALCRNGNGFFPDQFRARHRQAQRIEARLIMAGDIEPPIRTPGTARGAVTVERLDECWRKCETFECIEFIIGLDELRPFGAAIRR